MNGYYDTTLADLRVGDRVELHPACDRWMMGEGFATVTSIGRDLAATIFDVSGNLRRYNPCLLRKV